MIIVRIYEGLGNQLFQYAYARRMSLTTNHKVFLDIRETGKLKNEAGKIPRKYGLNSFKIALPVCTNVQHFYPYLDETKTVWRLIKKLSESGCYPYKYFEETDPNYNEKLLTLSGNWYLQGWFQDSRYFQQYEKIIKKEILLRNKIKISSRLRNILETKNTVSIHFRRGDYKKAFNALSLSYYDNACKEICTRIADPFWIIFSDEPQWVKENVDLGKDCYFLSEENLTDSEELMVMSYCRNHIIANSTYSWWGAWLGRNDDKIVVGPDKWILRGNYERPIVPAEWIQVPIK